MLKIGFPFCLMSSRRLKPIPCIFLLLLWTVCPQAAKGLNVLNYSQEANSRFLSGYTSAPVGALVSNTSASFVGSAYDWSGVGWDASNLKKSFGLISPRHYVVATHYGGAAYLQFWGAGGTLYTAAQQTTVATGYGPATDGASPDVTLGILTEPIPASAKVTFYPLLDLIPSLTSTSTSNYSAYTSASYRNYLMYGFTGNAASNTLTSVGYYNTGYYVASSATVSTGAALQDGDSGSPTFGPWSDPAGNKRLTFLGYNWAINSTTNFHALLPTNDVAAKLNTLMANQGYALRWVAPASGTWQGLSNSFDINGNWSSYSVPTVNSYTAFSGNLTSYRTISLNADQSARGIVFLSASTGKAFSFTAGNTLSLGRGGMVNYDANNAQTFLCNVTMTDAQWWDCGKGGLIVGGAVANGGYQLVIDGTGSTTLGGALSGTGGLAKEGSGTLTLNGGDKTFTGPLFVHNGILNLSGTLSGGGAAAIEAGGKFQGNGTIVISAGHSLRIGGTLSPGDASTGGTLQIAATSGSVIFGSGGTLQFNAGTENDRVEIAGGAVILGGTLQIVPDSGFSYASSYRILSGVSALPSGTFSAISGVDSGFKPVFSLNGTDYTLQFLPSTYSAWQQIHFTATEIEAGLAAETADPDSDGLANLPEYALGLDPRVPTAAAAPAISTSNGYLTLTVAKNPNATDLAYIVEVTDDLTAPLSWSASQTTVLQETTSTLVVRDNVPIASAPKRFIRLRITRQ